MINDIFITITITLPRYYVRGHVCCHCNRNANLFNQYGVIIWNNKKSIWGRRGGNIIIMGRNNP